MTMPATSATSARCAAEHLHRYASPRLCSVHYGRRRTRSAQARGGRQWSARRSSAGASRSGLVLASAAVPGTFTRSLSERSWIDQGLITGLATGTHFLLTAVAQDVIDGAGGAMSTVLPASPSTGPWTSASAPRPSCSTSPPSRSASASWRSSATVPTRPHVRGARPPGRLALRRHRAGATILAGRHVGHARPSTRWSARTAASTACRSPSRSGSSTAGVDRVPPAARDAAGALRRPRDVQPRARPRGRHGRRARHRRRSPSASRGPPAGSARSAAACCPGSETTWRRAGHLAMLGGGRLRHQPALEAGHARASSRAPRRTTRASTRPRPACGPTRW